MLLIRSCIRKMETEMLKVRHGKIRHERAKTKKYGVATLLPVKIDCEAQSISNDGEGHFVMTISLIRKNEMTVVDLDLLTGHQNSANVSEAPSASITFLLHRGSHHADFVLIIPLLMFLVVPLGYASLKFSVPA